MFFLIGSPVLFSTTKFASIKPYLNHFKSSKLSGLEVCSITLIKFFKFSSSLVVGLDSILNLTFELLYTSKS